MAQFFRHTRSLLLPFAAALFSLIFSCTPAHAINELVVGSFLDPGVGTLSRGGLEKLPRQQEALDFTAPLFLDSKGRYRVEAGYESQPTARIYSGGWKGSRADSERVATSLAAPFSLWGGALQGSVAAGYSFDSFKVQADNDTEGTFVHVDERFRARQAGVSLSALGRIRLGVSIIGSDYRDRPEIPLELEVAPASWFKLGYKRSYSDFAEDIGLTLQGHQGNLPLKLLDTLDELYGVLDYRGLYIKYAQELSVPDNRRVEARLQLPYSLYLVGDYRRRDFAPIDQGISVDGQPGGTLKATFKKNEYRAGLGAQLSSHWSVEANYRHSEIATEGGGIADTRTIAGFWPSLLLGNYNYLASASLASDQYHLGGQYQGEHFSFGVGVQYLDLRPAARIDYWRAALFGLGRAGAETKELTVDRIGMIFLATGIGYTWKNFEVRYAVGQFIPVSEHDTAASSSAPGSGGGGGGGGNLFSRLGDKIAHYPGGGVQRLLLSLVF
jgi:hypothetical protein